VFGRSVHDAARVLSVISGRDPRDSTCEDRDPLRLPTVPESFQGFVVGLPKEYFPPELDPAVRRACDRAIRMMKELGAAVREVSLRIRRMPCRRTTSSRRRRPRPTWPATTGSGMGSGSMGQRISAACIARRAGRGLDPRCGAAFWWVLRAVVGYYDAYYRRAQQMRALIAQDFRNVFDRGVDLLFTPTVPAPAFKAGEKLADPIAMYMSDIFTVTAISPPAGDVVAHRSGEGATDRRPLIGQAFLEDEMIEAAYALERVVPATDEA